MVPVRSSAVTSAAPSVTAGTASGPVPDKKVQEADRQRVIDAQVAGIRERERKGRNVSGKTSPLVGVFIAAIGLCAVALSGFLYLKEKDLQTRGLTAPGIVSKIESKTEYEEDDDGYRHLVTYYRPIYSFADQNGSTHSFTSGAWSTVQSKSVGQQVAVLYDPLDPMNVRIAGGLPYIGAVVTALIGLLSFIAGAASALVSIRREKKKKGTGAEIVA